jgi:carbon storage regulator
MLVLSRRVGHRIVIAGDIEITVVQIRGSNVRLGVSAPRHVSIERDNTRKKAEEIEPEQPHGCPSEQETCDSTRSSTNRSPP